MFKQLAREIVAYEGKKRSISIGQVNEVLRIALILLAQRFQRDPYGLVQLLFRDRDRDPKMDVYIPPRPPRTG